MTSRTLRLGIVVPLAMVLAALVAPVARAEDILRIEEPVTDTTGVLDGDIADIEATIATTLDDHGVQVFVLFVSTTEERTTEDYAFATAAESSLGGDDALVLVALDDRSDYIWLADGLDAISDSELDDIITGTLEPGLRDGDFGAAVIATVQALGDAASGDAATEPPILPGPGTAVPTERPDGDGSGSTDGDIDMGTILAILAIGGGGFLVWRQWRMRRLRPAGPTPAGAPAAPAAPPVDAATLARQANALLIATDERIRDAAQETDFAEAQYGPEAVTTFRAAVAEAREQLAGAFTIRQQLDDSTPEDEPTRIAMLQEIVQRTTTAQERLDAETERIRELRDLERDAPQTLVDLPARIEAVEDRLDASDATMAHLRTYAEAVWGPVRGNMEEARKGLAGARSAVVAGNAALASDVPDPSDAAVATRTALEGMTGAAALIDAIATLAALVTDAERRVPAELAEARTDLADAAAAIAGRPLDQAVAARRSAADAALAAAERASDARPADPVEALRLATEAHRLADEMLLAARDTAIAADRVIAAADSAIRTAAAEIERTRAFLESRRPGVGETARTRLAEAERLVLTSRAAIATDPTQALAAGRRAQALAQEAYRLAQEDFSDFDDGGPGWGQRAGTADGDQTAEILAQILGGVIGGALSGGAGRRSGGGWGGSSWGGGGLGGLGGGGGGLGGGGRGGGGGWGGGGGFGSGGFGGGGGGGRGAGGRW